MTLTVTLEEKDQDEWDELSARLAEELAASLPPNFQGLSDYAVSREGIYADNADSFFQLV